MNTSLTKKGIALFLLNRCKTFPMFFMCMDRSASVQTGSNNYKFCRREIVFSIYIPIFASRKNDNY